MSGSQRIEFLVEQFRSSWTDTSQAQRIEDFLQNEATVDREDLFRELLLADLELRRRRGLSIDPNDYHRFSEWTKVINEIIHELTISSPTSLHSEDSTIQPPDQRSVANINVGKYELIRELGRGGQAVTYLANDPDLKRRVVIKEYYTCTDPKDQEVVLNEGRALARVRSNYVAQCLTVERENNRVYLVMEFIRGEPMNSAFRSPQKMTTKAVEMIAMVAEGLYHVHLCGLVHRDIKPGNILVGIDGTPRLVDFGLAAAMASEELDHFGGTLQYMSPEQASSEAGNIDLRSDIFGLGAVLYWLLVGQPPFSGSEQMTIWDLAKRCDFVPPQEIVPDLPAELVEICLRAMARDPDQRFSSSLELATALRHWSTSQTAASDSTNVAVETTAADRVKSKSQAASDFANDSQQGEAVIPPTPYKGLAAFGVEDAERYFGRESYIEKCMDRILHAVQKPERTRFLAIVGASGSGKSSLAHAGLLAQLKQGGIPDSENWTYVVGRPGHDPIEGLAVALAAHPVTGNIVGDPGELMERIKRDESRLHLAARMTLHDRPNSHYLFILIDQFEELFRCNDADTKRAYIQNLLHAASAKDGRTFILLTMRADFYGKASSFPDLAEFISHDQILVGPMTEDELSRAIQKPAEQAGAEFEPGLVEMLVRDMHSEAGALPFLQDALTQLWDLQTDCRLTVDAYKSIGRLEGAIEHRAHQLYERLDPEQQLLCRRILLRLVQPGEGTEDTKRRVPRDELGSDPATDQMVQLLAAERLITTETDEDHADQNKVAYVEVSHEALIRAWSRLRQWIDEDRDALRIQHQLTLDAATWKQRPDDAFLYRGTRLGLAEEWMKIYGESLTNIEHEFLTASQTLRDRERQEKAAAAARLRWWARTAGAAALVASILAAASLYLAFDIHRSRQNEQSQRKLADARALEALRESRIADAQRLATQAEDLLEQSPHESALQAGKAVRTLFGPESFHLSAQDTHYPLKILREALSETNRRKNELVLGTRPTLIKPILSPTGRWLLSQMYDRELNLWDLQAQSPNPLRLPVPRGEITGSVFSENDEWLVAHSNNGHARVWKLSANAVESQTDLTRQSGQRPVFQFEATGRWLLAADSDTVRIWDLHQPEFGREPARVMRSVGTATVARFSGPWLLFDAGQGIELWPANRIERADEPLKLENLTLRSNASMSRARYLSSSAKSLFEDEPPPKSDVSADGSWAIVRSISGDASTTPQLLDLRQEAPTVRDLTMAKRATRMRRTSNRLLEFEFNEDGSKLLGYNSSVLFVWDLTNDDIPAPIRRDLSYVQDIQFLTADLIAISGRYSNYSFVLRATPTQLHTVLRLADHLPIQASPNGRWLVAAEEFDSTPVIYDLAKGPAAKPFDLFSDTTANHLVFTADSHWLVVAKESSALVWDLNAEKPLTWMKVLDQTGADRNVNAVLAAQNTSQLLVVGDWTTQRYNWNPQSNQWQPVGVLSASRQERLKFPCYDHGWIVDLSKNRPFLIHGSPSDKSHASEFGSGPVSSCVVISKERLVVAFESGSIALFAPTADSVERIGVLAEGVGSHAKLIGSPNGQWVVASHENGSMKIWNVEQFANGEFQPVEVTDHQTQLVGMAIDPDSKWLAARSYDGTASLRLLSKPDDYRLMNSVELKGRITSSANDTEATEQNLVVGDDWTTPLWNNQIRSSLSREQYSSSQLELFGLAPEMTEEMKGVQPVSAMGQPKLLRNGRAVRSDWSPNGEQIVFGGTLGLAVLDLRTNETRSLLPFGKDPTWSPKLNSGEWIAFVGGNYGGGEAIWIARADGSEARYVADGGFPSWSNDGRLWFRSGNRTSEFTLKYLDLATMQIHNAPEVEVTAYYPVVSPNGKMLAQSDTENSETAVLVSNIETGETIMRWVVDGVDGILLSWSPDSQMIAFGTFGAGREAIGIWALDIQRQSARQLIKGPYTRAAWSRDGKQITFDIRLDPNSQLWSLSTDRLQEAPELSHREFLQTIFDDYQKMFAAKKLRPSTRIQVELAYGLWKNGFSDRGLAALRMVREFIADRGEDDPEFDARYYSLLASVLPKVSMEHDFSSSEESLQLGIAALRKAYESGALTLEQARRDPILRMLLDDDSYQSIENEYTASKRILEKILTENALPRNRYSATLLADGMTMTIGPDGTLISNRFGRRRKLSIRNTDDLESYFETYSLLGIRATGADATAEAWGDLDKLWSLEVLDLSKGKLTTEVIQSLRMLPNLRELRLSDTKISDADITVVSQLEKLDVLDLAGTVISDTALAEIAKIQTLVMLDLSRTTVTADGLKELAKLPNLLYLRLQGVPLDSTAMETLAAMPQLAHLDCRNSGLSDDELKQLSTRVAEKREHRLALELTTHLNYEHMIPLKLSSTASRPFDSGSAARYERDHFEGLEVGRQEFLGIPFELSEVVLSTVSGREPSGLIGRLLKNDATKVGYPLKRLFFLHGARFSVDTPPIPHGSPLATYEVEFQDGERFRIPVIMGQNVKDWWDYGNHEDSSTSCTNAAVAWRGFNEKSRNWKKGKPPASLRLYLFSWVNPMPLKPIKSVSLVPLESAMNTQPQAATRGGSDARSREVTPDIGEVFCLAISAQVTEELARTYAQNRLKPKRSVEEILEVGVQSYRRRDYKEATIAFSQVLEIEPDNVSALHQRTHCRLQQEQFSWAVSDAEKLVRLRPNSAHYHYLLASSYFGNGDRGNALQATIRASQIVGKKEQDMNDRESIFDLAYQIGLGFTEQKEFDKSITAFFITQNILEENIALLGEDDGSLYDLACVYARLAACHNELAKPEEDIAKLKNKSVETIGRAIQAGYDDLDHISKDSDLDFVRNEPDFILLIKPSRTDDTSEKTGKDSKAIEPTKDEKP